MRVRGLKLEHIAHHLVASLSHPMRVRGLKRRSQIQPYMGGGRTLCGCVD